MTPLDNLVGKRFAKLTVVAYAGTRGEGRKRVRTWTCQCDCGGVITVPTSRLRRAALGLRMSTRSCGCLRAVPRPPHRRKPPEDVAFNALYSDYRKHARKRGYDFDLSKPAFRDITLQECHYCGDPPARVFNHKIAAKWNTLETAHADAYRYTYTYNGVDREDNSLGYVQGNVVPCCWDCNTRKRAETKAAFLAWVHKIARRHPHS